MHRCFHYFRTSDGLSIRYALWRSAGDTSAGSILYLPGRAEFMEKNLDVFERLCSRGLDVYALDWRGQGLSDRIIENRYKGYVRDYSDFLSDLNLFVQSFYLPAAVSPRFVLGHSMGGNIGLRYLHDNPGVFDRAVLVSPMFDINTFPFPGRLARRLTRAAVRKGLAERYIPGAGDFNPAAKHFRSNPLTSDYERFMYEIREIEKNPYLALGGVTYQWLAASFDSIDVIKTPGYAEAVSTPVLVVSGGRDPIVSRKAHRRICRRLPDCRLLELRGARHEILKEADRFQGLFWREFDSFIAQ
ncbi:MAG: alpha/beta fold hydrolase [Desulfosalsimonas sp.]